MSPLSVLMNYDRRLPFGRWLVCVSSWIMRQGINYHNRIHLVFHTNVSKHTHTQVPLQYNLYYCDGPENWVFVTFTRSVQQSHNFKHIYNVFVWPLIVAIFHKRPLLVVVFIGAENETNISARAYYSLFLSRPF